MAATTQLPDSPTQENDNPGDDYYRDLADKEFNPDSYQRRHGQPAGNPTDPRGNDTAAGDSSDPRGTPSRQDLSQDEGNPPGDPPRHPGQVGRGYTGGGLGGLANPLQGGFLSLRGRITGKRAVFGGGIIGMLVTLIALIIISGPAEFVQLAQVLGHNFTKSQSDSENRTTHLLRDFKAIKEGDYRYTRVGLIGAKVMTKVVGQFEDAGVKFTGTDILGRPTGIEVERSAVEKNFPETEGMNDKEFKDFLNNKFGVDSNLSFETVESGKSYKLDIGGLKSQSIKSFINKAGTEILGDNAAVSALKTRNLKKFFGISGLFHPLSTATKNAISAKAAQIRKQKPSESEGAAQNEAASDVADSTFDSNAAAVEEPGVENFTQAKGQENSFSRKVSSKLLPGAGLLWATGCTLKGVSDAIVVMNRSLTVLPAAIEASSLIGMGSEVQNGGSDITAEQLGATERGFTNSAGQSIWDGAALGALENSDKVNSLPANSKIKNDLPDEYKQAFGTSTTSSNLKRVGDLMLTWFPFHWLNIPGLSECGFVSGIVIGVVGGIAQVFSAIANAPDGEAGDLAINAAANAGADVAINNIEGELLSPAINLVVDKIAKAAAAPKLARDAFSGPLGGNLIAYGARAAANSAAILGGGLALGNATSTIIGSAGQEQQRQFNSESTFAKIFDVNDYRSLTGRLATAISPNPLEDLRLAASNVFNIGSVFTSMSSLFTPRAAAASPSGSWTGNYDWGFPQYGIPDNMLNDPALSDPYQNSEAVGQYLSSVCSDGKGSIGPSYGKCGSGAFDGGSYDIADKIKQCFGNTLTYSEDPDIGGSVWDLEHTATATSTDGDVNPVSEGYQNANCGGICPGTIADCNNPAEEQWEKIVMFVNDAWNIKALDCGGGYTDTSSQSCADLGADSGSDTSDNGGTTSFGSGTGQFTTNSSAPAYPGLDAMLARVKKAAQPNASATDTAAFCASIGGCSGRCESAVEMAWLGKTGQYLDPYGSAGATPAAGSAWAAALASGHAHPGDRDPPVGALLIYNKHDPSDPYGHITIYLGNNNVFSTDFDYQGQVGVDSASHIESGSWANSYVGWMDPYFGGQVGSP